MTEKTYLNEQEHDAYMEDFTKATLTVIEVICTLADKHNVDRDDVMKHFSVLFSTLTKISTFD